MGRGSVMVMASVARALIRCAGMVAENKQQEHNGEAMAYVEKDFDGVIESEGIGWNQVVTMLNDQGD